MRKIQYLGLILIGSLFMNTCDLFTPGFGSNVDLTPPLLFVTSHSNGSFVSGTIALAGNFEEDVATAAVAVSFDNGATWNQAALNQTARTWSLSFDTTPLPDGERDVLFRITDTSNKTTDKQIMLYFDNTAPLVMMTVPTVYGGSATYYGSIFSVKGETADTFGVESVSVQIWNDAETILLATLSASGTSSWTSTFDSATYVPASGTIRFTIIATDKAGNVSTRYYHSSDVYSQYTYSPTTPYTIDYVYQCLTDPASSALKTYLLANGTTRIPLYFDQAYNLPTIEVYNPDQNQPQVNNVLTSTSRLSGKAIDEDGILANSVEVYVIKDGDTLPTIDWTTTGNPLSPSVNWSYLLPGPGTIGNGSYTLRVRATDQGSNQRTSNAIGFIIDNDIPILTVTQPAQGQYLNGNFTIQGTATDSGWITNVEVSLNDGVTYADATLSLPNWSYTVTTPPDGSMLIKVRATDNTAKTSIYNLQVVVDRTNPVIGFTNPPLSSTVNGQVIFKGTSSDNTQITKVELKIGNFDPFIQLAGTYNWEYTIDSASYANSTHATEEAPPGSDVWRLTVQARATDIANNMTTLSTYYIFIDNDTDKPRVNIVAPTDGQNIGGPVLVTGIAWDDDGVARVEMQMDINGDGDFADAVDVGNGTSKTKDLDTDDRFENETTWYTLDGTNSWMETINKYGELYARGDTTPPLNGYVTIRVRAVDINGTPVVGNYQEIEIHLDDTIPHFENLNLASSDYVRGNFKITGDAWDDEEITSISISYNGGQTYSDNLTGDPDMVTWVADNHYTLDIDIDSAAYIATSGIFYLRLRIIDNASYQSIQYLNLNVDNLRPTGDSLGASDDIYGSGANSRIQGRAWDSGTVCGIDRTEIYFTRGDGSVPDPYVLLSPIGVPDGTPITEDFGDGDVLYVDPADQADFVISVDTPTELGNDDPPNGDDDGYPESLTLDGSTYNWWAEFDSSQITDGALTIHYVVFDKAGNGRHYSKTGFIKNHKPSITAIQVGTDLNMDSLVEGWEQFAYAGSFSARNRVYVSITASDPGGGIATYRVYHPNASGDEELVSSTGTIDISSSAEYPEGATTLLCRVTDTDGIIVDQTLNVVIDNDDTGNPTLTLHPLAQSDRTADAATGGHIELTGYDDADPDVSGTITIRGHAHDNQRIRYLKMTIDYFDLGGGEGVERTIAQWGAGAPTGGRTDIIGTWSGTWGSLTVSNLTLTEAGGHDFDWVYTWNTANVNNRARLDITVSVNLEDYRTVPNEDTESRDHDVVPYITGLRRNVGIEGTTRSKYGKYSVQQGETNLLINGYNLATAGTYWVRVCRTGSNVVYDEVTAGKISANATFTTLTISDLADITHSGNLRVTVNNIEAINHENNDDAQEPVTLIYYNREDDGHGLSLTLWNDDRYLLVWQTGADFGNTGTPHDSFNPEYPSMSIDANGVLYGAWVDRTNSRIWRATPSTARVSVYNSYDPPEFTDISVVDSTNINIAFLANNYYGSWATHNDSDDLGSMAVWTNNATGLPTQTSLTYSNNYFEFECLWHDQMLMQFQRPKIVRSGTGLHMAYFDSDTQAAKYAYVASTVTSEAEVANWVNLDGGTPDGEDTGKILTDAMDGTPARSGASGEFVAIDIDEDGNPVVMYYDINTQTLRLARATATPTTSAANWTRQEVFQTGDANKQYSGQYVTMKFDTTGNLYAACYNTANGNLVYLYADNVDGADYEFTSVTIDELGAVGAWADISLNGTTPYISYLNSSMIGTFSGLKVAYLEGGNWEYATAPLSTAIKSERTSIEYARGSVTWRCAVGYKGTNFDIVYLQPEE